MSNRKISAFFLAAALALPALSLSQAAIAADKPLTKSESATVRATVVAVDLKTREVTLKGEDGKTFEVQAGSHVEHLDQIKPGDVVAATLTESVAFQVVKKGERPSGVSESVTKNAGQSGEVGRTMTTWFRIAAYDRDTHVLWVTTSKGLTKKITVQDPKAQAKLANLSPGNTVKVTYTQTLALTLDKVAR